MLGQWLFALVIQRQLEDTPHVYQRGFQPWDEAELHVLHISCHSCHFCCSFLLLLARHRPFSIISEQPGPYSNLHQVT